MNKCQNQTLFLVVMIVAFAAFLVLLMVGAFSFVPQVYLTYPDRECVLVDPASAGSCENPPEKYTIVWVAPKRVREEQTYYKTL